MTEVAVSRRISRRALIVFIGVLVLVMVVLEAVIVWQERLAMWETAGTDLANEMEILGEVSKEALLRSDYDTVQGMVDYWGSQHDDINRLTATMPNGFVLAKFQRPAITAKPLRVEYDVMFNGRTLMHIQAVADFTSIESGFVALVVKSTLLTVVVIIFMGILLWATLRRTAILPLEKEIERRREKEQALAQNAKELEIVVKELDAFSYSVSHDLRAPLRAIDGFSLALLEDYGAQLDGTARSYLDRVRQATQRMGLLIDDLLSLSRISRAEIRSVIVDMSAMVRELVAKLQEAQPRDNIEVVIADHVYGTGDPHLLEVALDNLLGNAWKYTGKSARPRIEFGSREENGEKIYYIKDNGVGFDMKYADKLFGAFQRLHRSEDFPGTGVGLAIVARIITRHKGRLWAESTVGQGATFYFTLAAIPVA